MCKMRVSINTPIARLSVELPVEQAVAVMQMALNLMCGPGEGRHNDVVVGDALADEDCEEVVPPDVEDAPTDDEGVVDAPRDEAAVEMQQERRDGTGEGQIGHTGFLYLRCSACGKMRAFCAKEPIREHRCRCGHINALDTVSRMHVKCKCGAYFRYKTDLVADVISIDCFKCGAPVDLEYHDRKDEYQTIDGR